MQLSDLKIGMRFINSGPNDIPVYFSVDGTGEPILIIKPTQSIGQIVAFNGTIILFVSDEITKALPWGYKVGTFMVQWLTTYVDAAAIRFEDFKANVSDIQVQDQQAVFDKVGKGNEGLANMVEIVGGALKDITDKAAKGVIDSGGKIIDEATAIVPWNLVLLAGGAWILWNSSNKKK